MLGKIKGKAHLKDRLSAAFVASVKVPRRYQDGGGLFLQVDATGAKRWGQRLMVRGKRHDLGIGPLDLVSLAKARELARGNRELARKGVDPMAERARARGIPTFDQAAEKVLETKAKELRNRKHLDQWRNTLATYAAPFLGHRKVNEINRQDVLRALEPIWTTKTETASRLRGRIETVLDWAAVAGHRTGDNPARWAGGLEHLLPSPAKVATKGHHPAVAVDDAPRWWYAMTYRDGIAARALQFAALTWARSGEVRGATWAEIDLERDLWIIPASRMKKEREHRVLLSPVAVALLKTLPRLDGNPLVFPAPRGGQLSDMTLSACMKRLHRSCEDDAMTGGGFFDPSSGRPAVPHGLRSTARDWAAERGYDRDMAELALAHDVGTAVERAYRRGDMLDRRRAMLVDWAAFLTSNAAGRIVPMRSVK